MQRTAENLFTFQETLSCRWVHFQHNLLGCVGKAHKPAVSAVIKTVFTEKDRDQPNARWREVAENLSDRFRDVVQLMDEAVHDVRAYGRRVSWNRFSTQVMALLASIIAQERGVGVCDQSIRPVFDPHGPVELRRDLR